MHEKRAKEKEKRLLQQEKQLFHARVRSQIRAKLAGKPDPSINPDPSNCHGPMSPTDHIKALANRFMKDGAEDLWNEDDGPLKCPPTRVTNERLGCIRANGRRGSIGSPVDLRKLISEGRENVNLTNSNGYANTRNYSVQNRRRFRRNESSESEDDDSDYGPVREPAKPFAKNLAKLVGQRKRFCRYDSSPRDDESGSDLEGESSKYFSGNSSWGKLSGDGKEDLEEENERMGGGRGVRKVGSSASLGKYDMKITKRVPLRMLEEESDFSGQVELIRHELSKKGLIENGREKDEEESVLTQKRYANCFLARGLRLLVLGMLYLIDKRMLVKTKNVNGLLVDHL